MFRKLFLAGLLILFAASSSYAKEMKIGVADMKKILGAYRETRDILAVAKKKEELAAVELNQKRDQYSDAARDYEQKKAAKAKGLEEMEKNLEAKKKEIVDRAQAFNKDAADEKKKFAEKTKEVVEFIKGYARKAGYDLVVDSAGTLYFNNACDMTDDIIKDLNKK